MPTWLIPMTYCVASVIAGAALPRLEQAYLPGYAHHMSVGSALAFFSAVSGGMMALTGIVFAIAFVVVQFSALAYSPRIVVMFANSPALFHALGAFFATFTYSLASLMWTDRDGSGTVPLFSSMLVIVLLIISMLAFARLIQSLNDLQIQRVLQSVGSRGRSVIHSMFPPIAAGGAGQDTSAMALELGPPAQTLTYSGEPRVVARFDVAALVRLAQGADAMWRLNVASARRWSKTLFCCMCMAPLGPSQRRHCFVRCVWPACAPSSRTRSMRFTFWWTSRSARFPLQSTTLRPLFRRWTRSRTCWFASAAAGWKLAPSGMTRAICD